MDCNNTQTEELTYAKNKDPMYNELLKILSVKFIELSLTEPMTRFIIDFSGNDKPVL